MKSDLFRRLFSVVVVTAVMSLVGCGGSSVNRYVGHWDGSVRFHSGRAIEDQGRLTFDVSETGALAGTYERYDTGDVSNVYGSLYAGGSFRMNWDFPGYGSPRNCLGTVTKRNGQLSPDTEDGLMPTRNHNGSLGDGLEFLLEFRG